MVNLRDNYPKETLWRNVSPCYYQRWNSIKARLNLIVRQINTNSIYAVDTWLILNMLSVHTGRLIKDWSEERNYANAHSKDAESLVWQVSRPVVGDLRDSRLDKLCFIWHAFNQWLAQLRLLPMQVTSQAKLSSWYCPQMALFGRCLIRVKLSSYNNYSFRYRGARVYYWLCFRTYGGVTGLNSIIWSFKNTKRDSFKA